MKYKVLGYVFIGLVFLATISLLYYQSMNIIPPVTYIPPVHKPIPMNTFTDPSGQFTVSFSKDYTLSTDPTYGPGDYFDQTGLKLATITIPNSTFPGTNFADSDVVIAKDPSIKTAADCANYSNGTFSQPTTGTETINGLVFNTATFSDAGAGNFYDTRLYRIFHDQTCFEISLTLHTGNIDNYPSGSVTAVEQTQAWAKLTDILNAFKFTN